MYRNLEGLSRTPERSKVSLVLAFRTRAVFATVLTIGALVSIGLSGCAQPEKTGLFQSENTMVIPENPPKLERTCTTIMVERQMDALRASHTVEYQAGVWFVDGHVAGVAKAEDDPVTLCWQD